ncbi:hypothetical protein PPERSA_11623 [Pseudocohnilembus persalinus]|uniref:50S ribosomal protein L35 n=1 Tax=Pseudocohnilembus persalinus TaxID=266149 RepID=A0A0V0Q9Y1_PSEPJ|nr:hypothetical protein PPERSA_11623 [Pseudocohnilembus persalinus]|eukprot:KRW99022.1 hypothetical protein PPERSA_11623 [Pseudocohnilembus persalinus]
MNQFINSSFENSSFEQEEENNLIDQYDEIKQEYNKKLLKIKQILLSLRCPLININNKNINFSTSFHQNSKISKKSFYEENYKLDEIVDLITQSDQRLQLFEWLLKKFNNQNFLQFQEEETFEDKENSEYRTKENLININANPFPVDFPRIKQYNNSLQNNFSHLNSNISQNIESSQLFQQKNDQKIINQIENLTPQELEEELQVLQQEISQYFKQQQNQKNAENQHKNDDQSQNSESMSQSVSDSDNTYDNIEKIEEMNENSEDEHDEKENTENLNQKVKYNKKVKIIENLEPELLEQYKLTLVQFAKKIRNQISSIIYGKFNFVPHFNYFQGIPKQFKKKIVKGHLGHKRTKESSFKKAEKQKTKKYIQKAHYGLLKRIRIVGNKDERRFKFHSTGKRHLMRKKSLSNLKRKSRDRYIAKADVKRIKRLLPKWKQAAFKNRH